jgi:spermidine synthase
VDVVEINSAVVPLARQFFGFDPARVNLTIDDARHVLHVCPSRYDTIHLDAFLGDSSPSHLMTREAFEDMRRLLEPEGTLVINCFANFLPDRDFFGTSLYRTLQSVFRNVVIHAAPGGNVFFVASNQADMRVRASPDLSRVHPYRRRDVEQTFATTVSVTPGRGQVLTDDFNPVEFHDAPNRERIRRDLARAMQML